MILTWPQAYQRDTDSCGGKGWNLARLHHYGFQIPCGGVICSDLYNELIARPPFQALIQQVAQLPLQPLIDPGINAGIDEDNDLLNQIRCAFLEAELPETFRSALQTFLDRQALSNSFISVRSSVNEEDGEAASFAGIHDSVLNVRGAEEIEAAILKCFASLWSSRAIAYRRKMNIDDSDITAAVVINEMVAAESAGVAFSCDPASGRDDLITINANFGLGESVVAGAVEPDQYRLNRFHKGITDSVIGKKEQRYRAKTDGGCEWLPTEASATACLNEQQLKRLANLCDRVFHALGQGEQHQDIEWAYDGSNFILLQARPVTAMKKVKCAEISNQPDIWSNGNFRDALPMVVPHLMAELCDKQINYILHCNFKPFYPVDPALRFGRRFEGRFYINASLMQWLWFDSVAFPTEKLNINLGGHQPLIEIDPEYQKGLGRRLKRLWRGIQFFRLLTDYRKKASAIVEAETAYAEHHRKIDYSAFTDRQLIESLHSLDRHLSSYNYPFIMLTSQSGAVFMLIQTLEKHLGERAYQLTNRLMAGQSSATSANHGHQLRSLAQQLEDDKAALEIVLNDDFQPEQWRTLLPDGSPFKRAFSGFIDEYGHRAVYEIDLSRPRWREDPGYLFDCIKTYLRSPPSNNNALHQQQSDAAWQEIRRSVPRFFHRQIEKQLSAAAQGAALKELSKSIYVKLMEPMRLVLLEVGQRLVQRNLIDSVDDLFHCAMCELDAVMQGDWDGESLRDLIAERKALKLRREQLPAVDLIFDDTVQQPALPATHPHGGLHGIGAAMGEASGIARLIRQPEEGSRLQSGDVLVAPSTDPAWTPLFLNASAIVMETGGYLSHGSIVAREYGIPAVVNVAGLFNAIKDGDSLRVNGDRGSVEVLSG